MTKIYLAALKEPLPDAEIIMARSHNCISSDMKEPQIMHSDVMTNFFYVVHSGWIEGSQILKTAQKQSSAPRMI